MCCRFSKKMTVLMFFSLLTQKIERRVFFPSMQRLLIVSLYAAHALAQSSPNSTNTPAPVDAPSVYASGDLVLEKPVETTTIFLSVFLIAAILEFLIDTAAGIRNKYFRVIFNLINQEVMIIGVLVLTLVFTQTVKTWDPLYVFLFKWAMMTLFLMVMFFCSIVLMLIGFTKRLASTWSEFESERMDSATNLSGSEMAYKNGFLKFTQCMSAYGYSASLGVRFSDYLTKMIRRYMVKLTSLSWTAWICLAAIVMLNAIRCEITLVISQSGDENALSGLTHDQKLANYLSFILLQGYLVLGLFIAFFYSLTTRLQNFLNGTRSVYVGPQQGAGRGGFEQPLISTANTAGFDTLDDPRVYLFRRSIDSTLELLQIVLIALEWYTATFCVSYAVPIFNNFDIPIIVVLYVVAAGPLMVIPFLPRTLTMISMMASLGTSLDERAVQYFIRKAKIPEDELPAKMRRVPGTATGGSTNKSASS